MLDRTYPDFEPSRQTKRIWVYTRKSPLEQGGLVLPGLFQTEFFVWDTTGFFLVLVLEAWGLANMLRVGDIAFAAVAGLFMCDMILAVVAHLFRGPVCELNNRYVVETDPLRKQDIASKMRRQRVGAAVCSILIFALAAWKVAAFFAFMGGQLRGPVFAVLVSYALAATLHVVCTGHFLAQVAYLVFLRKDYRDYAAARRAAGEDGSRTAGPRVSFHQFESEVELRAIEYNGHLLRDLMPERSSLPKKYELSCRGILTDDELAFLVGEQPNDSARVKLAKEAVRRQLDILYAFGRPTGPGTTSTPSSGSAAALALVFLALGSGGCVEQPKHVGEQKEFSLHVVLPEPAQKGAGLPARLVELVAAPVESPDCPDVVFVPRITLVRVDLDAEASVAVEPLPPAGEWMRRFFEMKDTVDTLEAANRTALEQATLPEEFSKKGDPALSGLGLQRLLARQAGEETVWTHGAAPGWIPAGVAAREAAEAGPFRESQAAVLCEMHNAKQELATQVLLWDPAPGGTAPALAEDPAAKAAAEPDESEAEPAAPVAPPAQPEAAARGKEPSSSDLDEVRLHLAEGRLEEARRAVAVVPDAHPQAGALRELGTQLVTRVRFRITVRKADQRNTVQEFPDPGAIALPVSADEKRFRIQVEAGEDAYFYLYAVYGEDRIVALFPSAAEASALPIAKGSDHVLPSQDSYFDLERDGERLTQLVTVTSRWPARELERLGAGLGGADDREAGRRLLEAIRARQKAAVAGCDVRLARFERAG